MASAKNRTLTVSARVFSIRKSIYRPCELQIPSYPSHNFLLNPLWPRLPSPPPPFFCRPISPPCTSSLAGGGHKLGFRGHGVEDNRVEGEARAVCACVACVGCSVSYREENKGSVGSRHGSKSPAWSYPRPPYTGSFLLSWEGLFRVS